MIRTDLMDEAAGKPELVKTLQVNLHDLSGSPGVAYQYMNVVTFYV
jgi:hypothetical protein